MRIATTDARGREDAAAPGRPSREVTMALGAMGEVVDIVTAAAEDVDATTELELPRSMILRRQLLCVRGVGRPAPQSET